MSRVRPPPMEKNQNDTGITLSRRFSDAIHCTRKRMEKKACPRKPTVSQKCSALMFPRSRGEYQPFTLPDALGWSKEFRPTHARADFTRGHGALAGDPGVLLLRPRGQVDQLAQSDLEGDRDAVEAVHRDGLLAPLDLADELPRQRRPLAEGFLTPAPLLAQRTDLGSACLAHVVHATLHLRRPPLVRTSRRGPALPSRS